MAPECQQQGMPEGLDDVNEEYSRLRRWKCVAFEGSYRSACECTMTFLVVASFLAQHVMVRSDLLCQVRRTPPSGAKVKAKKNLDSDTNAAKDEALVKTKSWYRSRLVFACCGDCDCSQLETQVSRCELQSHASVSRWRYCSSSLFSSCVGVYSQLVSISLQLLRWEDSMH